MANELLTAESLGARVRAARKRRGFRSADSLAEATGAPSVTPMVVKNIELGRTADPTVSQVLNLARALEVSPAFLLAPLGSRGAALDLAGLAPQFDEWTVSKFDTWLSAGGHSGWEPSSPEEWEELHQLDALRQLERLDRERTRLRVAAVVEDDALAERDRPAGLPSFRWQLDDTEARIRQIKSYLETSGWDLASWEDTQ